MPPSRWRARGARVLRLRLPSKCDRPPHSSDDCHVRRYRPLLHPARRLMPASSLRLCRGIRACRLRRSRGSPSSTTASATSLGEMDAWGDFYGASSASRSSFVRRQGYLDRIYGTPSKVMTDPRNLVKFRSTSGAGQEEIANRGVSGFYHGAGVQHMAIRTDDIAHDSGTQTERRGVLDTPDSYYDMLEERVGKIDEAMETCESCASSSTATTWAICCRFLPSRCRTADALFRDHSAQGQPFVWERQLQGALSSR